jgi:peptidylprolyl isomerase
MNSSKKILIAVILILVLIFVIFFVAQNQNQKETEGDSSSIEKIEGLDIVITKEGEGVSVKTGDNIDVHYIGKLEDGNVFDSSRERKKPYNFTIGEGEVIKGWEKGVIGMKVGEIRVLTISPELGYGFRSQGPIPPNSTLIFEIELMSINSQD